MLVMVGGATTLAAHADPAGGGTGLLSAIDVADSKGIRVSQYELSIDTGNVLDTAKLWLSLRLMTAWELYRYGVGLVAYVFDWTLSMTWLNAIVTPLDAAARQIRDQLINPIGLAGVMLLISAVVGGIRIVYGQHRPRDLRHPLRRGRGRRSRGPAGQPRRRRHRGAVDEGPQRRPRDRRHDRRQEHRRHRHQRAPPTPPS